MQLEGTLIRFSTLPDGLAVIVIDTKNKQTLPANSAINLEEAKKESLEDIEKKHIALILGNTKSLQEASDILGCNLSTLWRKRNKYCLN